MRTLVDIPEAELGMLTKLSKRRKVSRAELVRTAISSYLESQGEDVIEQAFGLWSDRKLDGLEYERKLREEW